MESLILHGKAHLHEDVLTAALADLLGDLRDLDLTRGVIAACQLVDPTGHLKEGSGGGELRWDGFDVELWPQWPAVGEPDLVLWLRFGGAIVAGVVVEAKYRAAKSGDDLPDSDELRDQLGRYAKGIDRCLPPSASRIVVYLTEKSAPPVAELSSSWRAIKNRAGLDPMGVLRWVSWRDIDRVLRDYGERIPVDSISGRRVARVRELLACAGLECFGGWPCRRAPKGLSRDVPGLPLWLLEPTVPMGWNRSISPEPLPTLIQDTHSRVAEGWRRPQTPGGFS